MSRCASAYAVALAGSLVAALAMPALGVADSGSGGSGLTPGAPSHAPNNPGGTVQSGNGTVSASGNGITITTRASAFLRHQLRFTGSVPSSDAGATVEIERKGHQTGWTWALTAHARVRANGSFSVVWHTNHIGRFAFKAVIVSGSASQAAAASPSVTVTVYRLAIATIYGPGFWGSRTACGQVLRHRTLGVANRTLPCGTKVAIYYQGKTITVPVIDRGPYANNADWDLTEATANALGMTGTDTLGAVSLPQPG